MNEQVKNQPKTITPRAIVLMLIVVVGIPFGHFVVASGPYGWIRHPGYTRALLTYLATPFFLDSRWALLPGIW